MPCFDSGELGKGRWICRGAESYVTNEKLIGNKKDNIYKKQQQQQIRKERAQKIDE